MREIKRQSIDKDFAEGCAYSEIVEAGDFVFLTFCVGNIGQSVEAQVNGALDNMCARLDNPSILYVLCSNAIIREVKMI